MLFSDHRDGLLHGDEVILEFKQQSDVAEFIKEILDLFEKSEGDSMEASIKKLLGSL
ncbi:hypothetical protein [Clostridium tyrobutyricum]|uniref:hypothetical protein n=1 Tax=Clostridium tyrobutyricum TaxID=1519 RepID=UPI002431E6B4|nr:hypothetical protein [Clostridium tyrobutyricum]MCH4200713.1 hypothetical protein [Clostridium tyrobutyricum]